MQFLKSKWLLILITLVSTISFNFTNGDGNGKFRIDKLSDSIYELNFNNLHLQVDRNTGGRIISCRLGNKELLIGKKVNPEDYGSTFWPSPQSRWNWPPPATLDNKPYEILKSKNSLVLSSENDPQLDLKFLKEFAVDTIDSSFVIEYSIINLKDTARPAAPWEVTRVPGQLSFFPIGKNKVLKKSNLKSTSRIDGILWYTYNPGILDKGEKLFAEASAGWLAHVNDGIVFIKKFEHVPANEIAPGEGEVEIYATSNFPYIELENQGSQVILQPNDTLHWQVKWYIRALPSKIKTVAGNKELLDFVKTVLREK
jgi:hypothetical protein